MRKATMTLCLCLDRYINEKHRREQRNLLEKKNAPKVAPVQPQPRTVGGFTAGGGGGNATPRAKKRCTFFYNTGKCRNGANCPFDHSERKPGGGKGDKGKGKGKDKSKSRSSSPQAGRVARPPSPPNTKRGTSPSGKESKPACHE